MDDGKSTLIGRLLHDAGGLFEDHLDALRKKAGREGSPLDFSLVTDGLKAEREQGITIDVAYRYFETPRRRFVIADTPGHEQYTRNMATGASTADLAVILVDATLGVLVQSRRHAFIASLLGVPRVVVAVNKMDLVDFAEGAFESVRADFAAFARRLGFAGLDFIPVSAYHGDNVVHRSARMPWYRGPALLEHLENVYVEGDANLVDFRFPVQRVSRPDATFRGYAGTVASGVTRPGDEVVALPSGKRTRIERIVTFDGDRAYAHAGQAVTLVLADDIDVGRGEFLAHPRNVPRVARDLEAMVVWMAEAPLAPGAAVLVKQATRLVRATCQSIAYRVDPDTLHRVPADRLALNDIARAGFALHQPLLVDAYRNNRATGAFILIDPATHDTLGAGMVIERRTARPEASAAAPVSGDIAWQEGLVPAAERARRLGQRPLTLWLTGLPGSGKSTLARALERRLVDAGRACYVLDGDNVRHGLNRDLGFSAEDRDENIRRVAEVARLLNDAGLIVIAAFISPLAAHRRLAREIVGSHAFVETFVAADPATCERRDPKGHYAKARAGNLPGFTGLAGDYEAPGAPDLVIDTAGTDLPACVALLEAAVAARQGPAGAGPGTI